MVVSAACFVGKMFCFPIFLFKVVYFCMHLEKPGLLILLFLKIIQISNQ